MVSIISIICMVITLLICLLVPIGLGIYCFNKYNISVKAVFVGALIFFVFQVILRIPILGVLARQAWYQQLAANAVFMALFLGLTAGLFEEVGRFVGYKFLLKRDLEWKNGIAFGIGHGGIEAILITGLTMVNNLVMAIAINTGSFDVLVGSKLPAGTAKAMKDMLLSTAPYMYAVGGMERIFAITMQIALSVFLLYGIVNRKNIYLLYAILLHALVDSPVVYLSMKGFGIPFTEGFTALIAVFAFLYIYNSKDIFRQSWGGAKYSYIEKP